MKKSISDYQLPNRNNDTKTIYWRLPFIKNLEKQTLKTVDSLNKILPEKHKIVVAYRTLKTSNLFPNKDKIPLGLSSNVVYNFTCKLCSNSYIGETKRHLFTRMTEHIRGVPNETEISKHLHPAGYGDFSIIHKTKFTKIAESIVINHGNRRTLNEHESSYKLLLFT